MQGNPWLPIAVVLPMLGALAAYLLGRRQPRHALIAVAAVSAAEFTVLSLLLLAVLQGGKPAFVWEQACVMGLALAADGFTALYAWIAVGMWCVAAVFSVSYFKHKQNAPRYAFFTLLTLGAVVGVFLSDQLLTTIVFFEIMSLASYPWVAHDETPQAMRAAQTYLWIAVVGGLCLLIGMLFMPPELLPLRFSSGVYAQDVSAARLWLPAVLMLVGFGAKAGAFPLHVWLPKAHPVAPAPASALLSGMLLKTGVFGIVLLSAKVFTGGCRVAYVDLLDRHRHHDGRRGAGAFSRRDEAHPRVLQHEPDRVHPAGGGAVRVAAGARRHCCAGRGGAYG